jgi:DUF1016 N-terminal domain/EcoEI R protein C-terminal
VLETLARDLQAEFPGRNGFSARNLWNMRDFYLAYCDKTKLQPLVAEISWAKNLVILARCKDDLEREFYLRATARFGWTKAVLAHQVDNHAFNSKQQTFLDFVLSHYVAVGVDELDQEKLTPLLRLQYHDSITDAVADLGRPDEIGKVFSGFQKYLYEQAAA